MLLERALRESVAMRKANFGQLAVMPEPTSRKISKGLSKMFEETLA